MLGRRIRESLGREARRIKMHVVSEKYVGRLGLLSGRRDRKGDSFRDISLIHVSDIGIVSAEF